MRVAPGETGATPRPTFAPIGEFVAIRDLLSESIGPLVGLVNRQIGDALFVDQQRRESPTLEYKRALIKG